MDAACDLEVDVNGEEVFLVNKKTLSSFSGRLSKLFSKPSVATSKALKVIFHDLPGGADAFELVTRFCYNHGKIRITPANTCLLHCVAYYMEMTDDLSQKPNLIKLTQVSLEGIPSWTWLEILTAMRECQDFYHVANCSVMYDKILDSLVARIVSFNDTSPSNSSPESSALRLSCDSRSTLSTKNSSQRAWWFEDLTVLNSETIGKAIRMMVSRQMDQVTISRFLFYYLKTRSCNATSNEKHNAMEIVVDLLYSLDRNSVSCKGLFGILRVSSCLSINKCCRSKLESMIGFQIDRATLDNLLVPSPAGVGNLYDVKLVLRLLKYFLSSGGGASLTQLKRVGSLIDLYLAEVAPDPCLKPRKFVSLLTALPHAARDSYDGVYRVIDMYLEVHAGLSEDDKMKICCSMNYEKLSSETSRRLAQNSRFPSRTVIQALISQQSKLKSLLQDTNHYESIGGNPHKGGEKYDDCQQVILYSKKIYPTMENEKLKAYMQGMQWRVMELEKILRKMQTQMTKIMKSKISSTSSTRSLPKMCS